MEKKQENKVQAVPEGFHSVTPYLCVDNAAGFIEFVQKAFGGKKTFEMKGDDQKIMHATVSIGDSNIMICDAMETAPAQPGILYLYVEDADRLFRNALEAKAEVVHEMKDQFYGDRVGAVKDPCGNVWWIGTHVEDVDPGELQRRSKVVERELKQKGREVHA